VLDYLNDHLTLLFEMVLKLLNVSYLANVIDDEQQVTILLLVREDVVVNLGDHLFFAFLVVADLYLDREIKPVERKVGNVTLR